MDSRDLSVSTLNDINPHRERSGQTKAPGRHNRNKPKFPKPQVNQAVESENTSDQSIIVEKKLHQARQYN